MEEQYKSAKDSDYEHVKISELGAKYSWKLVDYDGLVVGVKRGRAVIRKAYYLCMMCDRGFMVDVPEYGIFSAPQVCPDCKRRSLKLEEDKSQMKDFLEIYVQELPQNEKPRRIEVKKPHPIICDVDNAPAELGGVLHIRGVLLAKPPIKSKGKPSVALTYTFATHAIKIESCRDAFLDYVPTSEDLLAFQEHFAITDYETLKARTNGTIAPYIKGRELGKLAVDVASHSELAKRCNVALPGDSRTGKSEILLDMAQNLYPAGADYVACENASRTGISYTIDTSGTEPELRFGALAACDTTALCLDAVNALHPEEQKELREAISQGRIKVDRLLKGEALARVRIIAALNLPKDRKVNSYTTRAQAALESFYSTIDRNRYDFVIIFGDNDVSKDDIDAAEKKRATNTNGVRSIPADIYQKHLCYCWQHHEIKWEDGVYDHLIDKLREIRKAIGPVQLISNEFTKTSGNWCVAFAQRCHSFDNGAVIVKKEHVDLFDTFVKEWLSDLEIDKARKLWADVSDIDVPRLTESIASSPNQLAVVKCIAKGMKHNSEIVESLGLTKSMVSQTVGKLEDLKVVEKRESEYFLTTIGVRVANELLGKLTV